jgi:glycosyltransferase involved in cell wall biosynthesis
MKILNVTMFYLPVLGGQSTYIQNLINTFEKNGHDPFVIQPFSQYNGKGVIKLKHIPFMWKFVDSWFIFNWQISFKKKILRKYDIIISHYSFHYPVLKWHKKVIVLSHGLDWHQPPISAADKYREFTARMGKNNDCFLVANDSHFMRYLGINIPPAENFFKEVATNKWFIPNCIDTKVFYDFKQERQKRILVPRTVRRERGIHVAIEAFYIFQKTHTEYVMDVVGIFDPRWEYYRECLLLLEGFGITEKVKFQGGIPWEKLQSYYNQSMITLIPTIEMEGTSLSALESMACGTPVISSNAGGLCDLPTLKAAPDGKEIALKMEEVLKNWDIYSATQMESTRSLFNLENWSAAWLKVVHKVYNS